MDQTTTLYIVSALFAASELLSLIPSVKANGIFQLIVGILGVIAGQKKTGGKLPPRR